jgi:tetratricopeptide (TPR) repeat protein
MIRTPSLAAIALAASLAMPSPAHAVFSGDMSPRGPSGDADYAAGVQAWQQMDWEGMIEHLDKVVARRPWHDNAHTLLGYAHRRLGNYETAFYHYDRALAQNERHRGAMAYMGIAYLHLDDTTAAEATLARLRAVCESVVMTFTDGDFGNGCAEWAELKGAIEHYAATGEVIDICPDVGRPDA